MVRPGVKLLNGSYTIYTVLFSNYKVGTLINKSEATKGRKADYERTADVQM